MGKIKDWWYHEERYVYINDENDEIVNYATNGEVVMGMLGGIIGLVIFIAFAIIVR